MTGIVLIYNYGFKNWEAHFFNPTFDFNFKITIPSARKERDIILRDNLGRILSSKVPELPYKYAEK